MRKVIAVIALCMLTGTASYGAVSDDVYVRKDVFEVYMQSVNSKLDIIMEDLKAQRKDINDLTKAVSGLSERVTALSARTDGLEARMGDLRNDIYLGFVLLGIIIAWPRAREVLQKIGKTAPSVTLEDVKRLIEEQIEKNNAKLGKSLQV